MPDKKILRNLMKRDVIINQGKSYEEEPRRTDIVKRGESVEIDREYDLITIDEWHTEWTQ